MPNDLLERFTSRKFLLSLIGLIIVTLASAGAIPLSDDNLWQLITIILGYIGVEGAADITRSWREAAQKERE